MYVHIHTCVLCVCVCIHSPSIYPCCIGMSRSVTCDTKKGCIRVGYVRIIYVAAAAII